MIEEVILLSNVSNIFKDNDTISKINEFGDLKESAIYNLGHFLNRTICDDVPNSLYKYTTLNFYTLKNLYNKTITLTRPVLFNDPFDSLFYNTGIANSLPVKKGYISLSEAERKSFKKRSVSRNNITSKGQRDLRIASLTSEYDNFLMWSLYADNDRGICISYDFSNYTYVHNHIQLTKYIFPVVYTRRPFNISSIHDYTNGSEKLLMDLAYSGVTKSSLWKAEKEWRIILPLDDKRKKTDRVLFYRPNINKIYLGPNFIGYWLQIKIQSQTDAESYKKLHSYFYPFCRFVQKHKIQLQIMKLEPSNYGLKNYVISIKRIRRLDIKDRVLQKYFNIDFIGRY